MLLLKNYSQTFLTSKNRVLFISKLKRTKREALTSPDMQRVRDVNSQLFISLSFEVN